MDLAALAGFFDKSSNGLRADVPAALTSMVLNPIGLCTCAIGYPADAVPILRNAWNHVIKPKPQHDASAVIINLSEALLGLGNLQGALAAAQKGRQIANSYAQDFLLLVSLASLANVEHQMGNQVAATILFEQAEDLQSKYRPDYPKLYSLRGYHYFDFLLSGGEIDNCEERANWLVEVNESRSGLSKLDLALGQLACGRAAAMAGKLLQAKKSFNKSVDSFRIAGDLMRLPMSLLARAAFLREIGEDKRSQEDLNQVRRIASRGKMRLFECDAHLEYARLEIKQGQPDAARGHVKAADVLIADCGYHRRDGELLELKEELRLETESQASPRRPASGH